MAKNYAVAGFNALNGVELNLFTNDELKAIHYATMEVLMNPGVQVSDPEARQIFKEKESNIKKRTWRSSKGEQDDAQKRTPKAKGGMTLRKPYDSD